MVKIYVFMLYYFRRDCFNNEIYLSAVKECLCGGLEKIKLKTGRDD